MKISWTWFHKLGSPKWFYAISGRMLPWLASAAVLLLLVGITWGLAFAPQDYQQGNSFRIIYIHWRSPAMCCWPWPGWWGWCGR